MLAPILAYQQYSGGEEEQLLDQEANRLTNARWYERNEERVDTRTGSHSRMLLTKAGEVTLNVLKLRTLTFETAIIQRYQKREIRVEEALVEMYLAGVSVRRVEDNLGYGVPEYLQKRSAS